MKRGPFLFLNSFAEVSLDVSIPSRSLATNGAMTMVDINDNGEIGAIKLYKNHKNL